MKDFAKEYFEKNGYKRQKCCICGCDFYDFSGNNPAPIVDDEDSVCCPLCDRLFVIPAREAEFTDDEDDYDEEDVEEMIADIDGHGWEIATIPVEVITDHINPAIEMAIDEVQEDSVTAKALIKAYNWLDYVLHHHTYTQL